MARSEFPRREACDDEAGIHSRRQGGARPGVRADIYITLPHSTSQSDLSIFEDVRRPRDGPPLHIHHREDEFFRIVEGKFHLRGGEETFDGGGDSFFLLRDIPHTFISSGDTVGRLVCVCQPDGFEQFFLDMVTEKLQLPEIFRGSSSWWRCTSWSS